MNPQGQRVARCKACKRKARAAYKSPWNEARFWDRVDRDGVGTGCMEWRGPRHENGYGLFGFAGRTRLTHRIALMIAGIEVPPGMVTDHLCRNRLCCNVAHLEIVTQRENVRRGISIFAEHAAMTHCRKCGLELAGANLARRLNRSAKTSNGHKRKTPSQERICLNCWPRSWMYAVEKRDPPPRAKTVWRGPEW